MPFYEMPHHRLRLVQRSGAASLRKDPPPQDGVASLVQSHGPDAGSSIHRHHWVIAEPGGPLSAGVCKHCSGERMFRNSTPESGFITAGERQGFGSSRPGSWRD